VLDWLERHAVHYLLGVQLNAVLNREVQALVTRAAATYVIVHGLRETVLSGTARATATFDSLRLHLIGRAKRAFRPLRELIRLEPADVENSALCPYNLSIGMGRGRQGLCGHTCFIVWVALGRCICEQGKTPTRVRRTGG